jgi:hypothetical protein
MSRKTSKRSLNAPPPKREPPEVREQLKRPPGDQQAARAKSTGHGKKTADKWNQ